MKSKAKFIQEICTALDIGYLEKWAVELGVVEELHELLRPLGEASSE